MLKNILIINSSPEENQPLIDLFEELNKKNYSFLLASAENGLLRQFQKNNWPRQKIFLGPRIESALGQIFFIILLPLLYLIYLLYFAHFKTRKRTAIAIFLALNEKIIATPIAKLFKIKTIWIEDNSVLPMNLTKPLFLLYKLFSQKTDIITFNNLQKSQLKNLGIKEDNIKAITPAIRLNRRAYQDNLFLELARRGGENFKRKFFTVGTMVKLNKNKKLEMLFSAVKNCLIIIPNIQLIIVGDGEEKKNLGWLSKKMEIDHVTWFISSEQHIRKWLESFDIFVVTNELLKLPQINIILRAMEVGIPILGPKNMGLEDILPKTEEKEINLFEDNSNEMLTRQIIKLWRDKRLRKELGILEKKIIIEYFSLEKQAEEFEKIL
jgi:glycosyltransferase involved in cell wall biosynthesis